MSSFANDPGEPLPVEPDARRAFLTRLLAFISGLFLIVTPLGAGTFVLFDSLRRKKKPGGGKFVRITTLDVVPDDGLPHPFPVVTTRWDQWNKYPAERIATVYLRREPGESRPKAYSSICPHLGCFVDFKPAEHRYHCPCHNSRFDLSGKIIPPTASPREMDELQVEIRKENEVWVHYQRFRSGKTEKIADV